MGANEGKLESQFGVQHLNNRSSRKRKEEEIIEDTI